jgi:hypothetical protein
MTATGIATPIPAFAPVDRPVEAEPIIVVVFVFVVEVIDVVGGDVGRLVSVSGVATVVAAVVGVGGGDADVVGSAS